MIKKVKWKNNNVLGNLELDFTKPDGTEYKTIILAGENGTGKTTILDTLSSFLNMQSITPFEYVVYSADGHVYRITPEDNDDSAKLGFHLRREEGSDERESPEYIHSGGNVHRDRIYADVKDLRHYGVVYSKARSGFKTKPVTSTTTLQVDSDKHEADAEDDFTHIKQLLIDIDSQDAAEWLKRCKEGGISDQSYVDFEKQSKGYRFTKAFNAFFDNAEYEGIDNTDTKEKRVVFKKHGHRISADQLSTGEKQIVFRGAHLLRYINSIIGGIVLIDEPELSMHPKWQKKILQYYRGLFTNNGQQTVQMIIATHSEYVIQSALNDRNNVLVITLTDENGIINARNITTPNILPSITAAETNYITFGVPSIDYHIELYGYLQTKTSNHRIEDCDLYISQQAQYDSNQHEMIDNSYPGHHYITLPTYIRNAIDHPDSGRIFTEEQLQTSIKLLIELCR